MELTKSTENTIKTSEALSNEVPQLSHIKGQSIFLTDTEGHKLEIKNTEDGSKFVFTKDEEGKTLAIEERKNGAKLYHISADATGLPSSHEMRLDKTEIVYFFNATGSLKHYVELRGNGDRISTVLSDNGSVYSIEQRQIGGIIFQGWLKSSSDLREGMVWLHSDGEISTHGDDVVIKDLLSKFSRFLDGLTV